VVVLMVNVQQHAQVIVNKPYCIMLTMLKLMAHQHQPKQQFQLLDQLKQLSMFMKISSHIAVVFTYKQVTNLLVDMLLKFLDMVIQQQPILTIG